MGKHSKPDDETPEHKHVRKVIERKQAERLDPEKKDNAHEKKEEWKGTNRPGGLTY